jgi:TetR/AcrR family transcriptional regulator, cholesterol catabolism regulator
MARRPVPRAARLSDGGRYGEAVTSSGQTARRERDKRLPEVLDAAVRVFWEKGYSAATVQDIADALGILKGSLYHYVSGKEDLLAQVLEAAHADSMRLTELVAAMDAPPLRKLHEHFRLHMLWYLHRPEHVTVFFRDWRFLTGERLHLVTERRRGYDRFLRELLAQCQRAGDLADDVDLKYVSFFLLGAMNAAPSWYRRDGRDSAETLALSFADLCVSTVLGTRSLQQSARRPA